MTAIANLPATRPFLFLDFANSGRTDPRIRCIRSSSIWRTGANGVLESVAANTPAIDYDLNTGRCNGLICGALSITNLFTNSGSLTSRANSTEFMPNDSVDVPTPVSGATVTKVVRTSTAIPGRTRLLNGVVSLAADTALSPALYFYVPAQSGITKWSLSCDFQGQDVTPVFESATFGRWVRAVIPSKTTTGARASVDFSITVNESISPPAGFVAYFTGADLQVAASVGPHIPTGASAVTVAGQTLEMDLPTGFNQSEGTIVAAFSTVGLSGSGTRNIVTIRSTNSAGSLNFREGSVIGGVDLTVFSNNESIVDTASRSLVANQNHRAAIGYASGNTGFSMNGLTIITNGSPSFPISPTPVLLRFGEHRGHIQSLAIYSTRLTDAQLQRISA